MRNQQVAAIIWFSTLDEYFWSKKKTKTRGLKKILKISYVIKASIHAVVIVYLFALQFEKRYHEDIFGVTLRTKEKKHISVSEAMRRRSSSLSTQQ